MLMEDNRIIRSSVSFMLIVALVFTGLFLYPKTAYADRVILSEEVYRHLDMGVQLAYSPGSSWGQDNIYGSITPLSVHTSITFNNKVEVIDTYPVSSSKGSNFDFNADTSSHNIPKALGSGNSAYQEYYADYTSTTMTEGSCNSSEKTVSFSYTAILKTPSPLEVVSYGRDGADNAIYQLFGGKAALEREQPKIADAIAVALKAGREGTAGNNKLYLIFCPNVIEYKKYITVGDLEAQLNLPATAKQNTSYTAADASFIDSSLTVETVTLEKHYGNGEWQPVASWSGRGPGQNSGGSIQEKESNICTITYRLTVITTNGQVDTDIKIIHITDARTFEGEADLILPRYSYEGHPVEADDFSTFTVDGEAYSARRMYEEGLASNTFKPQASASASMRKLSLTSAEITFPKKGTYNVTLEVKTKDGKTLTDGESIDIYKTPKIAATLSGRQKENRKQSLNISVATYPGCPITALWAELEGADGTETVRLYKDGGLNNSDTIKTRAITTESITQYFSKYRLDFLTKNTEAREYKYTVYVMDSRGYTDQVEAIFTVAPDLPPNAVINVEDSFIRNKGTDVATVTMEDGSTTDGDQVERTWHVSFRENVFEAVADQPNYRDISFETGKKVSFNRTGVGKVDLKIDVRDVWTEETLPEYITDEDYKRSSTVVQTDIVNIAPVVSISPVHTKTAGILMLAAGQEEYNFLSASQNTLMEKLIEKGIDGEILIENMTPKATTDGSTGYTGLFSVSLPVGFNADSTFLENHFHMVDNETLYTINATWTGSYHDVFPQMPYYITAWDPYTKQEKWSYTLTSDVMNIATSGTKSQKGFAQDDQGKYLFFRYGGETLVLSKDNGAYLTKLNVELGDESYLGGNAIYTIKTDGIYSISTETGYVKKVYSGTISGKTKKLNNAIHFLAKTGPITINRGELSLTDETLKMSRILGTENDPLSTEYTCLGIDIDGVMFIGINNNTSVRAIGSDNSLIKTVSGWHTSRDWVVAPAYDEKGKCEYLVWASTTRGGSSYNDHSGYIAIYEDNSYSHSLNSTSSGNRTDPGYFMYAGRIGDKLYLQLGSMWAGLWGGGSVMGYYTEYANLWTMNPNTRQITRSQSGDFAYGAAGEYGNTSENFFAPSYSYNLDQQELHENGLNAKVVTWNQNIDEILSRYLKKLGLENKELNTVFLYDNSNQDETNPMGLSLAYLKEKDTDFIFAQDPEETGQEEPGESYGKRIVDGLKAAGQRAATLIRESSFINDIAALIAQEEDTPKTVLSIHNASGSGDSSISREYRLDANKTYFYEYEIKTSTMSALGQPLSIDYKTMQEVPEEKLLREGYMVVGIEEEDFNDIETNPFFTVIPSRLAADGTYNLATLNEGKTSLPNYQYSNGSEIKFTVPEGKKAILVFDYNMRSSSGGWANSTIMVNGDRYHRLQFSNPITGTYTHPEILPSGENVLSGYVEAYGTRPMSSWSIIDNLKVIYIENDEISNKETINLRHENGENQVFEAPTDGVYNVSLWGPSADSNGGLIEAKIKLNAGDVLEAYLGPSVPLRTNARNGANGTDGNGFGDDGPYKATLKKNGEVIAIAGGGASHGNPGSGDGSLYRRWSYDGYSNSVPVKCGMCGINLWRNQSCSVTEYYGVGGAGGAAGIGGHEVKSPGAPGLNGSNYVNGGASHRINLAGGAGGSGGAGGASFIDESQFVESKMVPGGSSQNSRLRISYNKGTDTSETETEDSMSFTTAKLEESWLRYNGILKTPYKTMAYRGQPMDYVFQEFAVDGNNLYATRDASDPDREKLTINIPSGKFSIDSGVNVYSSPRQTGDQSGYSVTWTWGGHTFIDQGHRQYGAINSDIPSPYFRIVMNTIQDTHTISAVARAYNGTAGRFLSAELQMVDELNAPINEGKYFFDKKNETVYLDNDKYIERAVVTISGGEDESWQLRDFKIYSIEKGVKVYVTGDDIEKTSELSKWTMNNATGILLKETKETTEDEIASVVYKKGQLVAYDISYSDYENDPSKKQFWRYTHTPFSDGPHPDAAVILDANGSPSAITGKVLNSSIPRFYIDGKYTVEHWQEDNTTRGLDPNGNPDYDKASNIESLTFYVEGSTNAPWITSIRTIPGTVKEGENYKIQVGVDDLEKDILNLTTEVYKERRLIYSHRKTGITADQSGNYPYTLTGYAPIAQSGTYEVVCTVSDETGTGLGTYRFIVTTDGKIMGYVNHTDQWDTNRKGYNLKRFDDEINRPIPFEEYMGLSLPRMRGTNVFWSGEKFLLEAITEGNPKEVKVRILEEGHAGARKETGYHTSLNKTARKRDKGDLWAGELWQNTMINRWGRKTPQKLIVIFEAIYEGNKTKIHEEEIIVDSNRDYWQLHRLW